jgi:hypothetical protein
MAVAIVAASRCGVVTGHATIIIGGVDRTRPRLA